MTRTAGSATVTISSGASLTFTSTNWSTPQTVTVAAAPDTNTTDDNATLTVSAAGLSDRTVQVLAKDTNFSAPAIISTPLTTAVVNAEYRYRVIATGNPAATFQLTSPPAGMTVNATGLITWTPTGLGTFPVSVTASNGQQPDATQTFQIVVAADAAPVAGLTRPLSGEVVSGNAAEFFGDCDDDVGCVRGEFYVDGVLINTDTNDQDHFHVGGQHLQWDTTTAADGPHTVRLVVVDTAGQTGFAEATITIANGSDGGVIGTDGGTNGGGAPDPLPPTTGSGSQRLGRRGFITKVNVATLVMVRCDPRL